MDPHQSEKLDLDPRYNDAEAQLWLKGRSVRLFFDHSVVPTRIDVKDSSFFGRTLAAFSVFGECAKIFQQLMRTP